MPTKEVYERLAKIGGLGLACCAIMMVITKYYLNNTHKRKELIALTRGNQTNGLMESALIFLPRTTYLQEAHSQPSL
jgi:hypothetical protein